MVSKNTKFHEIAHIFCNDTNTPQEDTVKVGEEALLCVYNGSAKNDPNSLRYERYSEKVNKFSNAVEAYNLPPTSAATRYHSLRIYFQVNEENGKKNLTQSNGDGDNLSSNCYPRLLTCRQCCLNCWRCFDVTKIGYSSLKCTCPNGLVCMWQL